MPRSRSTAEPEAPEEPMERVRIPVVQADGEITLTRPGVESRTFPVVDHWVDVAADDPFLRDLLRLEVAATADDAPTVGDTPGSTDTPEAPADPQES